MGQQKPIFLKILRSVIYFSCHDSFCEQVWFEYSLNLDSAFYFILIHYNPKSHFYRPLKGQKTSGFLTFLWGIKIEHWTKMD